MRAIVDTGFLVALVRSRDVYHAWALDLADHLTEPLLTCEAVLSEAAFHLGDSALVLEMVQEQFVRVAFDCNDHLPQLISLAKRYRDRSPDLADLCLIRMSEINPKHFVVTVDADFRVYRRNKREVIPLVAPPQL